jgi:hypothetical protein
MIRLNTITPTRRPFMDFEYTSQDVWVNRTPHSPASRVQGHTGNLPITSFFPRILVSTLESQLIDAGLTVVHSPDAGLQ